MFVLGPIYLFLVAHRFMSPYSGPRERWSVHFTNLALLALGLGLGYVFGFAEVIGLQVLLVLLSGTAGIWLFYIQHQFEDTYWKDHPNWKYIPSALQGSSYYRLPAILQWFTGNIGLHHIHHLNPKIPNYNLPRCFKENPVFQQVTIITFWESFKAVSLKLWDEEQQKLVGFRHLNPKGF
jgi:omega-6 fatty acid desaturase (delta-12 desaturase)